jgi:signal transduction histidine kinase
MRPARPLHDASRNPTQAADPEPHLRGVEGDPTRLSRSGPGSPLWQGHRGRLRVHADADRFGDWVDNMSSPSVPESGNGLHISQQMLEMLVCDNGMGIPVEHLERVFDRFPCVDTRITREVNGLGLGLTMCKRVAQMLGVMILAENKPHGKGSVVHVHLPTDEIPSM